MNIGQTIKNYSGRIWDALKKTAKNVRNGLRYQFTRMRNDIKSWREAIEEAERQYLPSRVKMQRLFIDTVLNEHILACMQRRKNLSLLRKFRIVDANGNEDENLTKLFKKKWFRNFQSYVIDAKFYGYSLIYLNDVIADAYPKLTIEERQCISPDGEYYNSIIYAPSGVNFTEQPYSDWYIWVTTPSDNGASKCGYGLLYVIAKTEIYLKNNTAFNADYIEVFGQPLRIGTTSKQGEERDDFEKSLSNMGSSAYVVKDDMDKVELIESANAGRGFQSYADFEKRLESKISKIILGHADALDSTPGKLGPGQGEDSPIAAALTDKQTEDGTDIEDIVNEELIPRMQKHGFKIPLGYRFEFVNDDEKEAFRSKEDASNKATADLFKAIKDAGGEPDWKYFEERTGIKVEKAAPPQPLQPIDPNNPNPKEEKEPVAQD